MRQELFCRSLGIAATLVASLASAQTSSQDSAPQLKLEEDRPAPLNRFGLSYRMGLNISAKFKNLGGYPALAHPGVSPDGTPWNYDNGYVLEDVQGNNSPFTWNWGYNGQPSQAAQVPGDGYLHLSRASASGGINAGSTKDDPQPGVELTYNRELGRINQAGWGVEGAFNYLNVAIRDNRTLYGNVTVQSDAFALNGVVPPAPPYYGDFTGPVPNGPNRPVISQDPTAGQSSITTIPNGASITGQRKVEADLYGFRFGPYAEIPMTKKLALSMSAGLAVADVNTRFKFNETVTIPGVGSMVQTGSATRNEWLVGGYAAGGLSYSFNRAWSAKAGMQYQFLGHTTTQAGNKQAELDLQRAIFVTIGIGYSF